MKLRELKLTNFRGYQSETSITLDDFTVLIGRNDAGKSTLLDALDIFFNEANIERGDCCVRTNSGDVKISCVFDELPDEIIIDANNKTTLQDEFLLRADGLFEITKHYHCSESGKGKLNSVSAKAHHPTADGIGDLLSLTLSKLKTLAKQRDVSLESVNETISAEIRAAIREAAPALQLQEIDLELKAESGKAIWEQIKKQLPVYALFKSDRESTDQDAEAKGPMAAAIKEAVQRRMPDLNNVLGDITAEVQRVADRTVDKIKEMNPELARQLNPQIKNKNWDSLFTVSLTGEEQVPINKRGSGTRRLVLLNFFRAKAEEDSTAKQSGIIYAIEEPETSQHPDHQVMLLKAFRDLVDQGSCQVIMTTHTPTLARKADINNIRFIERIDGIPYIYNKLDDEILKKVKNSLGALPDHDIKCFIGVEGGHDIEYFKRISRILAKTESDISDLEKAENEGAVSFIPLGGSSLELWVNRLEGFGRPEFYITDRDNPPNQPAKYQVQVDEWNARGATAKITRKRELENYLHPDAISSVLHNYVPLTRDDFEDIPKLFSDLSHASGSNINRANPSRAKKILNRECVDAMTPELLSEIDTHDEIRSWLREIKSILDKA